jgi:uncharacterized protein
VTTRRNTDLDREWKGPVRTCVGCRDRDQQTRMLRVALIAGRPTPDLARRLPGRGAWLHPRVECVEQAARRGGLSRAFRTGFRSEEIISLREAVLEAAQRDGN